MKQLLGLILVAIFLIGGCGSDSDKLKKDTHEYELAKALAEKHSYLDPDQNNVLVKTNNFKLTVGEVITALFEGMGNRIDGLKDMPAENLKQYFENISERLAEQKMLLKKADAAGIKVSESEVDSLLQFQYERAGGVERFKSMLERTGVQMDFIRRDLEKNRKINRYLETILEAQLEISEQELQQAYNQDKTATVRHILMNTQGKSEQEKMEIYQKMEKILAEAKSGKDFATLANNYSEDPGSNTRGGLYEDFEQGAMVEPFDRAAFSLPVGEISDIVETQYGYHILKVLDRKKDTRPYDQVRSELLKEVKNQKRKEVVPNFIEELKQQEGFEIVSYES
ncbi:MAG TPA: hypothetical protein ENN22_03355 [bacterium]|nr:hypothetical protein [bacterium]